jgi:hypothetical protein
MERVDVGAVTATPAVPTYVYGQLVLAGVKVKPEPGEYPHQWIVICQWRGEYTVWDTWEYHDDDDTLALHAQNGFYTHDNRRATAEFLRRLNIRELVDPNPAGR